ncbi:MAG: hypothetical protein HY231_24165 [Acidobacteria bacterium]|nr:hypothetical protein [Acidobacteriota bacterium]
MGKQKSKPFQSTHNLAFEVAEWRPLLCGNEDGWQCFRVGTCEGLWRATADAYEILAVINSEPNNGHFEDVLEWFERSCRRDRRTLRIRELLNEEFRRHLMEKRGFIADGKDDLIKRFQKAA